MKLGMPKIVRREGESIEELISRFKRNVNKSGVLEKCREKECFMNNATRKKLKAENAKKRQKQKRKFRQSK